LTSVPAGDSVKSANANGENFRPTDAGRDPQGASKTGRTASAPGAAGLLTQARIATP
jgi:hypothetical protein